MKFGDIFSLTPGLNPTLFVSALVDLANASEKFVSGFLRKTGIKHLVLNAIHRIYNFPASSY
jgi:hypothetical protein